MRRLRVLSLLLLLSAPAAADESYEERLVEWGLQQTGRERDPNPEGKRITEVLIVSEDVVSKTDPYPQIVNLPHVKTKPRVIRRELLLAVGDLYDANRVSESERNLRSLFLFAIARVVPLKTDTKDAVALLVVTKDLWSIRFNNEFSWVGGVLQYLRSRPREQNFLGLGKVVSLDFEYRRDTLAFGELYDDRRLFGSPLSLQQNAAVIFNRATNVAEGSRGLLSVGRPLYSLDQTWGFDVTGSWSVRRARLFRGGELLELPFPDENGSELVPFVYDVRAFSGGATGTYRTGKEWKRDLTFGLGAYSHRYQPPAALPSPEREWLTAQLPRSEDSLYLYAAFRIFEPRFAVMHNVDTFSLSEDVQVGPSLVAQARYSTPLLGSPTHFLEAGVRARYTLVAADNLFSAIASVAGRYTPGGDPVLGKELVDESFAAQLQEVTPYVGPGRIVARALWYRREDPLSVAFLQLGGDNGLRGIGAEALRGRNELLFNLEYRSKPLEFHTLHAGFVAFYDAGTAYDVSPNVLHSLGIGLRFLFPQFDVQTLRIDFGYTLNGPAVPLQDRFSASFGQVTDDRPAMLNNPLD